MQLQKKYWDDDNETTKETVILTLSTKWAELVRFNRFINCLWRKLNNTWSFRIKIWKFRVVVLRMIHLSLLCCLNPIWSEESETQSRNFRKLYLLLTDKDELIINLLFGIKFRLVSKINFKFCSFYIMSTWYLIV